MDIDDLPGMSDSEEDEQQYSNDQHNSYGAADNDIDAYAKISKSSVEGLGSIDAAMDDASSEDENPRGAMRDDIQIAQDRPTTSAGRAAKASSNWDLGVSTPSPEASRKTTPISSQDAAKTKDEEAGKLAALKAQLQKESEAEIARMKTTLQQEQEAKLSNFKAQLQRDTDAKKSAMEAQSKAQVDKVEAEGRQQAKDAQAKADDATSAAAKAAAAKLKTSEQQLTGEHETKLAELKKAHAGALDAARQENESAAQKKEKEDFDGKVAELKKDSDAKLAKAKADAEEKLESELAQLNSDTTQEISELRAKKMGQAKVDLSAANEAELKRLRRSAEKEKEELKAKQKTEMAALENALKTTLDKEKTRVATELAAERTKLQALHKDNVLKLKDDIKTVQDAETKKYGDELKAVKDAASMRVEMNREQDKLEKEFKQKTEERRAQVDQECEQDLAASRKAHNAKLSSIQRQHCDAVEKLEKELKATAAKHRQTVQKDEEQKLHELQREIETLREECDREQQQLKSELQQAKDRYEVSVAALKEDQAELDAKRDDVKDASAKHAKLAAEISNADETIATKSKEIAALTEESTKLSAQMTGIKTEHEEATQKLADTNEALDKARVQVEEATKAQAQAQNQGGFPHPHPHPHPGRQAQRAWGPPEDANNTPIVQPPASNPEVPPHAHRAHVPQQAHVPHHQAPYMHVPYPLGAHTPSYTPPVSTYPAAYQTNVGQGSRGRQPHRYAATYSNNGRGPSGVYTYPNGPADGAALSSDDEQLQWAQGLVSQHARQKSRKKASKVLREMRLQRKTVASSVVDHDLLHDIKQILSDSKVDSVDVDYIVNKDRYGEFTGDGAGYRYDGDTEHSAARPARTDNYRAPKVRSRPDLSAKAAHTFDVWAANREHTARVLDHHADWLQDFRQSLHRSTLDMSERACGPPRPTMHYVSRSFLDKYDESI